MLQIAVAGLYFINKVLLSLNKKSGWQIGILASILAVFYFSSLKMYLLVGLEVGFMAIQTFGLFNHKKEVKHENLLYFVMSLLVILLYFVLKNSPFLEFLISLVFILAIFFLAKKKIILGWGIMLLGHLMMAYFTFQNQQHFFAVMQVMSIFVALFAIWKIKQPKAQ